MTAKEGSTVPQSGDEVQGIGWVASSPNWEPTEEEIRQTTEELADTYSRPNPNPFAESPAERAKRVAKTILPTRFLNPPYGGGNVRVLPADPWGWTNLVR